MWIDWCNGDEAPGTYLRDRCNSTIVDHSCAKNGDDRVVGVGANRSAGNLLNRLTLANNSIDNPALNSGQGLALQEKSLDRFRTYGTVGSLYVEGDSRFANPANGARLQHRYVNGVLMDGINDQPAQLLWLCR